MTVFDTFNSLPQMEEGYAANKRHFTYGPLTRYAKLRVVHAPGKTGMFSPPSTPKETASERPRHVSRHVRHARAVMHAGIANPPMARKSFPAFPVHAQPAILRIRQEAHANARSRVLVCLQWEKDATLNFEQMGEIVCNWTVARYTPDYSSQVIAEKWWKNVTNT